MVTIEENPYDQIAAEYDDYFDSHNPFYGPINSREQQIFEKWVQNAPLDARALDIGCGTGVNTRWLVEKGYQSIGIDTSNAMLDVARQKHKDIEERVAFLRCDALRISQLNLGKFDVIVCFGSTLNHVHDWNAFFQQVSEHLKPHGRFVFGFDNALGLDTLFWLFRRKRNIYRDRARAQLLKRWFSGLRGVAFHNHWCMHIKGSEIELPLTYEPIGRFQKQLETVGLSIKTLTGVHLLSCFNKRVMEAGAYIEAGIGLKHSLWCRLGLHRLDDHLAHQHYRFAANIVGCAFKM